MKKETAEEKLTQLKQRIIAKQDELKKLDNNLFEVNGAHYKHLFDDASYLRFLRARDLDVDKAEAMILGTIKWRLEFKPHMISCKDIEHHFKQGKNYFFWI